jgi:hypothetical protein
VPVVSRCSIKPLFYHLISACEQHCRHLNAERFRSPESQAGYNAAERVRAQDKLRQLFRLRQYPRNLLVWTAISIGYFHCRRNCLSTRTFWSSCVSYELPTLILGLLITALRGRLIGFLTILGSESDLILIFALGVFAFWFVKKLVYQTEVSRLLKAFVIVLCSQAVLWIAALPAPLSRESPHNHAQAKQAPHTSVAPLNRGWRFVLIAVLLIMFPVVLFMIASEPYLSDPSTFSFKVMVWDYGTGFCAALISCAVGIRVFKRGVRNQLLDVCGSFIAFVICALEMVHWLKAVGENFFMSDSIALDYSLPACLFGFYSVVNLVFATKLSRKIVTYAEEDLLHKRLVFALCAVVILQILIHTILDVSMGGSIIFRP